MCAIKNAFWLFPTSISNPENIDTHQISMFVCVLHSIFQMLSLRENLNKMNLNEKVNKLEREANKLQFSVSLVIRERRLVAAGGSRV